MNLFNLVSDRVTTFIIVLLALLSILLLVFVRSSIEVGEERVWFIAYLFIVPPIVALFVVFAINGYTWILRISLGAVVAVLVVFILVQTVLFADKVYEYPARYSLILPGVTTLERLYFSFFSMEPGRYARHQAKAEQWREITRGK